MKEFDYEATKKGAKVQTRDGRPARIICWDMEDPYYPIVALCTENDTEWVKTYTRDGRCSVRVNTYDDLVMAITKKEGWINIYPNNSSTSYIYDTERDADSHCTNNRVACVHVEWSE